LFSQLHQHKDALEQARFSTRLTHALVKDLLALCDFYTKKKLIKEKAVVYDESILQKDKQNKSPINNNESQNKIAYNIFENEIEEDKTYSVSPLRKASVFNYLEEDLSLIERTAQRVKPIIEALTGMLVKEKRMGSESQVDEGEDSKSDEKSHISVEQITDASLFKGNKKVTKKVEPDMRIVLGYLNQLEMIANLNIGNIMQIQPVRIEDMLSGPRNETQFNRASFIDKISLICVSYFCISTEIRFIIQLKEDPLYDEKVKGEESEYWHSKSLEIACSFLPSDCPLLNHIHLSYQKHHSPCQQTIQEDTGNEQKLKIVKPLKGIESSKFNPILRRIDARNISITPPEFSPATTITNQMILSYQSYLSYGSQSYNINNKSNILDYSSNKDKSRNTGTTRHRSASHHLSGQVTPGNHIPEEKETELQYNSVNSGHSFTKKNSVPNESNKIIDKLLSFIMKDKGLNDKDKLLDALMLDDFEIDDSAKGSAGK
jgi:hypothetical protein